MANTGKKYYTRDTIFEYKASVIPRDFLQPIRLEDCPPVRRAIKVDWDRQTKLLDRASDLCERMTTTKRDFYSRPADQPNHTASSKSKMYGSRL